MGSTWPRVAPAFPKTARPAIICWQRTNPSPRFSPTSAFNRSASRPFHKCSVPHPFRVLCEKGGIAQMLGVPSSPRLCFCEKGVRPRICTPSVLLHHMSPWHVSLALRFEGAKFMQSNQPIHFNLVAAAHASMIEHGFQPEYPAGTDAELTAIKAHPAPPAAVGAQDLRSLLWSSIDNDTSKDLDQIEWAEQLPDGRIRVLIGVADVDARVALDTVIDSHAKSETTSVYTGVKVFPMLPAELSEGITSLNENEDRVAHVIEFSVDASGTASDGKVYAALVRNRAQLAYNGVGAWLEGTGPAPAKVAASADLDAQLKLQDAAAQRMVGGRFQHGALDLETIETRPLMQAEEAVEIVRLQKNR